MNRKTIILSAMAAVLAAGAATVPAAAQTLGDIDGSGSVNVTDVTTLVNMILGVIPKDQVHADVDGSGTLNVSDVTALIRIILGIH